MGVDHSTSGGASVCHCVVGFHMLLFSLRSVSDGGMYVTIIVVSILPCSVIYISLSFIGSISFTYCRNLLFTTIATPAVNYSLPPSPLKNHVYCFLESLVFCLLLVS